MKKILLTLTERFGIRNFLNEKYAKGGLTLETLKDAQHIMEKVSVDIRLASKPDKDGSIKAIGGDEAKKVNLRQVMSFNEGRQSPQLVWDAAKDKGREVLFSEDEMKLLQELIKEKDEKKELGIGDTYLIELSEKLETAKT